MSAATSAGGGDPDNAKSAAGRLRAGWRRFADAVQAIDDCWIGDVIGGVGLFALGWFAALFLMVIA